MKKDSTPHTSQDYDRKHGQDHIVKNPRAVKDLPNKEDLSDDALSQDIRKDVRHEHTNHFTNREGHGEKK
jgi:hypothetical protein